MKMAGLPEVWREEQKRECLSIFFVHFVCYIRSSPRQFEKWNQKKKNFWGKLFAKKTREGSGVCGYRVNSLA